MPRVHEVIFFVVLILGSAAALPRLFNESIICAGGRCEKPDLKFERIIPSQPGYQWGDAGGYCGSWAVQRATLPKGAWVSQQQVRDHTSNCGGHDSEILSCNIDEALVNLKIAYEGFDYESTPIPQTAAYFKWLKAHLAAGNAVAWMIMWDGQEYPIYDLTPPAGMYGHVEPVIGIQSNHPLDNTEVYDDDVVLHYTDGGLKTVHRVISTLPGKWAGEGEPADCGNFSYCIGNPYGFGWAVEGFAPEHPSAMPASLRVDPWISEPDVRAGEDPEALKGTLTVTGLTNGTSYDIYRWDSVEDAFVDYGDDHKRATFNATTDTFVFADDKSFQSDGATYYTVLPAGIEAVLK